MDIDIHRNLGVRLVVVETGRRRRWTEEAKRRIVEESFSPGASASSVARRHGLSPAHLFAWRRLYRRSTETGSCRLDHTHQAPQRLVVELPAHHDPAAVAKNDRHR